MSDILKRVLARLPAGLQQELKRVQHARQIRRGKFHTDEPEFSRVPSLLGPGDWAIDIGANIGHYTARFSEVVGESGRVVAFEPIPATFELLSSNVARFRHCNVTLLNACASNRAGIVNMVVPSFGTGLKNYYQAHVSDSGSEYAVYCISVDSLQLPHSVRLIKIDAEGQELAVLGGMSELLKRDHPWLIVENGAPGLLDVLAGHGYKVESLPGSPNLLCEPPPTSISAGL
jgi:FkbM family methyltransferase